MKIEKSFFTTREAARELGVAVATVQLWADNGMLQAWKTQGGHRRIERASVERLLHRHEAAPAQDEPARLRMMVVDDDVFQLGLYEEAVPQWHPHIALTTLNNAFEALLAIGRCAPDLLVVDLQMPGMDGFSMLKILGNADEMRSTRMVVVTGLGAQAIAARGGLPGGMEVLAKPIPFERLKYLALEILHTGGPNKMPGSQHPSAAPEFLVSAF